MKKFLQFSLLALAAFAVAACQPAANTNTASNANSNANVAAQPAAPTAESLLAMDKKAWEAYSKKDGAFFETFLADDFVGFENGKRPTRAETIKMITENKCEVESQTLTEPRVTAVGADVAVLTYKGDIKATCDGQKLPSPVTAMTVFVRKGSDWKAAYHNEVVVVAKPADANKAADAAGAEKKDDEKKDAAVAEKKEMPAPVPPPASNTASNSNTAAGPDALTDAIMAIERRGWNAWMKKDAAELKAVTADDLTFVDSMGDVVVGQSNVIARWTSDVCTVTSVSLSDGLAKSITKDVAILTYKGAGVGKCGGEAIKPLWGTTVAIKSGDVWKAVYIVENPIQ